MTQRTMQIFGIAAVCLQSEAKIFGQTKQTNASESKVATHSSDTHTHTTNGDVYNFKRRNWEEAGGGGGRTSSSSSTAKESQGARPRRRAKWSPRFV